ncbi:MAG: ABC transporter permease [Anaerolineae bacterium]|nr:ABC transporter permease [Anaerolineae bacterium]MDH7472519.1 ABC transporter permease [Anaerolineae bacterium]
MSKNDTSVEQTLSEAAAHVERLGFLRAHQRLLLWMWGGLLVLVILALAGIVISKKEIDLFLPLLGLLVLMAFALVTIVNASFAWLRGTVVPILAVVTALIISSIIIAATDPLVLQSAGNFFEDPTTVLRHAWDAISLAYRALFEGAVGSPAKITAGLEGWIVDGDSKALLSAVRPLSESVTKSIPYILTGLAVALGFRAGLFNIGAEGQYVIGGLCAVIVGYQVTGLPAYIHLPLAVIIGALAGGLWAAIPGLLKAWTGAHEVINTIMMNWIAFRLTEYLLREPLEKVQGTHRTPDILPTAELPRFFPHPIRLHAGLIIAVAAAIFVYWFLWKTTWGFEMRTVGANPDAARYGGISIRRNIVLAMFISGILAGLAGVSESLGVTHNMTLGFQAGYGFDSIALALLGGSHPLGVVLASLLFGVLRAGGTRMMSVAAIPLEITSILQAMVIIFIAAPAIIRGIYRLRAAKEELGPAMITRGWGS